MYIVFVQYYYVHGLYNNDIIIKKGVFRMSERTKKTEYDIKYAKDHLKRIPLDVPKDTYIVIKQAADAAGETVNGYIKKAIQLRMGDI